MKNPIVKQKEGESRKDYLIRVSIAMLEYNAYCMKSLIYDDAVCDALCLAEDLRTEFDIE